MSKDDGGSAFPISDTYYPNGQVQYGCSGMTLRDYFANSATEEDLRFFIPNTIGGMAQLLLELGMIKPYSPENISSSYGDKERLKLRYWAKYKHADEMLTERSKP